MTKNNIRLKPGDMVRRRMNGECSVREIVDVRATGYGWKYPEYGKLTPAGGENYWLSENSTDPFFETWEWLILANRRSGKNSEDGE